LETAGLQQIRRVLGIDLAMTWPKMGSAMLSFSLQPTEWVAASTAVVTWPNSPATASVAADVIDEFARRSDIAAVSLDGPQGWRDPAAVDRAGVGRACEKAAGTPGKTGTYGTTYPGNYVAWTCFCVDIFAALLKLPHVYLANDSLLPSFPLRRRGEYWLLECFPTSTWRASGLTPLPGHAKAPPIVVESFASRLRNRYSLPAEMLTRNHDELQAVVAALPASALLGAQCQALSKGEASNRVVQTGVVPAHAVEGLIWDATLT
jgi:hypothetical protein